LLDLINNIDCNLLPQFFFIRFNIFSHIHFYSVHHFANVVGRPGIFVTVL